MKNLLILISLAINTAFAEYNRYAIPHDPIADVTEASIIVRNNLRWDIQSNNDESFKKMILTEYGILTQRQVSDSSGYRTLCYLTFYQEKPGSVRWIEGDSYEPLGQSTITMNLEGNKQNVTSISFSKYAQNPIEARYAHYENGEIIALDCSGYDLTLNGIRGLFSKSPFLIYLK